MNTSKFSTRIAAMTWSLLIVLIIPVFSQDNVLKNVIPPSPNVASLGKYGEVPVSTYTGIPSISVPLYDIKNGNLSLPISLSYHAGGVRVEEIASSVGLGWALNAGGMISRSVRGLPDEVSQWNNQPLANRIETIMQSGNTVLHQNLATDVRLGTVDGEADIYTYNINGLSGKFFYDQQGNVHTIPSQNILISEFGPGWKIIGEDGTVYTFTKSEQISSSSCSGEQIVVSAWFLANIKSSDGKKEIKFTYEQVNYVYSSMIGETRYVSINGGGCLQSTPPCVQMQSYLTQRIKNIDFEDGYVEFIYNNTRCDLVDDKSLDEVRIFTTEAQLLRKFVLAHSYFGDNSDGCNRFTEHTKRLKLESVTEHSPASSKPPFEFQYNETNELPSRFSYAQDHWGYYNGKTANQGLVPTFSTLGPNGYIYFAGADRRVDPSFSQSGILTEIKYPTGGSTIFSYESNTVSGAGTIYDMQTQGGNLYLDASNDLVSGLPSPYESASMSVLSQGAFIEYSVSGLGSPLWQGCDIVRCLVIKDNNEASPFRELQSMSTGGVDFWPEGSYKLKLITECGVDAVANFVVSITAKIITSDPAENRLVGGLRILKIEDRPGSGGVSLFREYRYHKDNDESKSSGVLTNLPIYQSDLMVEKVERNEQGEPAGPSTFCQYRVVSSFSNYPLATTNGSYVGYGNVVLDLKQNGETWHSYTVPSAITPTYPFAPIENFDWRAGFLLSTKDFAREGTQLRLVRAAASSPFVINESRIYGIKTGTSYQVIDASSAYQPPPDFAFYPVITEFYSMGQSSETTYDQSDQNRFFSVTTEYLYNPIHLQAIQVSQTTRSTLTLKRQEMVTHRKYPFDFTFTGTPVGLEAVGIKKLQDLHIVNQVIEEYQVRRDLNEQDVASNQRFVGGSIQTFKSTAPYPDKVYRAEISGPLSTFAASSIVNNAFNIEPYYKPAAAFLSYDEKGNLTSQRKTKDVPQSIIWGYDKSLPIAVIDNANVIATSGSLMQQHLAHEIIVENGTLVPIGEPFENSTNQTITPSLDLYVYSGSSTEPPAPTLTVSLYKIGDSVPKKVHACSWGSNSLGDVSIGPGTYQWYFDANLSNAVGYLGYNLYITTNYVGNVDVPNVFHTSFEENGSFNDEPKTGRKVWQGPYTFLLPGTNGNYKLSYWEKSGTGEWLYHEQTILINSGATAPLTIGSSGNFIDEVRLLPNDATMTTYTFDPLIGITSVTDANNITIYYEHDDLGRLKIARDNKRNILKRYEYHYTSE